MVRADRRDVERRKSFRGFASRHAGERLRLLVERHQRDHRQARDAAHGFDRVDELLEVVERLDHEQVRAAALEHAGLLARTRRAESASVAVSPRGPIEPAMKTSRPVTSRASRASFTAVELICSSSSSRNIVASLRRLAPKLFASISSAPALMKPTWSETTASGARRFASSGQRSRGTAAEIERAHAAVGDERRALSGVGRGSGSRGRTLVTPRKRRSGAAAKPRFDTSGSRVETGTGPLPRVHRAR